MQETLEGSLHGSVPRCTAVAVTARILSLADQSNIQREVAWWPAGWVKACCALLSEAQAAAAASTAPLLLCRALCALQALLQHPLAECFADVPEVSQHGLILIGYKPHCLC